MFQAVLVANRGEIAVRIIRALQARAIRAIAVYTEPDVTSLWRRLADEAVAIGAPGAYLDGAALIDAALASGAVAIHPGYGFLSEQATFARQVLAAGLAWIGPPPEALALFGDKIACRDLAKAAGLAVLPGGPLRLGAAPGLDDFPVMIKAAAGGGGIGLEIVRDVQDLPRLAAQAAAQALAAFGDGRLYWERYLHEVRHVEVQVAVDAGGQAIALGTRDCSWQRRHQKLLEEAPAGGLPPDLEDQAAHLFRQAGYQGLGTAEFLWDGQQAYFMEANARLQVEHAVTEEVSGLDLVGLQLAIAAGEALPGGSGVAAQPRGFAIEARVYAENPITFAPTPGRIGFLRLPTGPGIRVDTGIEEGSEVPAHYDALLFKVIARGATRQEARSRLALALSETRVGGDLETNLAYLSAAVGSQAFAAGPVACDHGDRFSWVPAAHDLALARVASGMQTPVTRHSPGWRGW